MRRLHDCSLSNTRTSTYMTVGSALLALALCFPIAAQAEDLLREQNMSLALAQKAAATAVDRCRADGYRVTVAVADRNGLLRAQLRADGAGPHTLDSSRRKAFTAASLRRPTSALAELLTKNPTLQGLRDMSPEILILGGGLPAFVQGDLIGAIGVGGAPGTQFDDACAQAGLDAIGATASASPAPPAAP